MCFDSVVHINKGEEKKILFETLQQSENKVDSNGVTNTKGKF